MEKNIYDEINNNESNFWWFQARLKIVEHLITKYIGSLDNKTAVDIGCGTGMTTCSLQKMFRNVTAFDMEEKAVEFTRAKGIDVYKGSLPNDMPPIKTDLITMLDVLEHIEDDHASVERCCEFLNPGGIIVLTVPANPFLWSNWDEIHYHKRRYVIRDIQKMFPENLWKKELLSYYNTLLAIPAFAVRLIFKKIDSGYKPPSKPVNSIFRNIFAFERFLLGKVPMPFGVSIVGVFRKK